MKMKMKRKMKRKKEKEREKEKEKEKEKKKKVRRGKATKYMDRLFFRDLSHRHPTFFKFSFIRFFFISSFLLFLLLLLLRPQTIDGFCPVAIYNAAWRGHASHGQREVAQTGAQPRAA